MDPRLSAVENNLSDTFALDANRAVPIRTFPKDASVDSTKLAVNEISVVIAKNVRASRVRYRDL